MRDFDKRVTCGLPVSVRLPRPTRRQEPSLDQRPEKAVRFGWKLGLCEQVDASRLLSFEPAGGRDAARMQSRSASRVQRGRREAGEGSIRYEAHRVLDRVEAAGGITERLVLRLG
jgi:hypothetical protein